MHFLTLPRGQQLAHGFAHFGRHCLIGVVEDTGAANREKKLFKLLLGRRSDAAAFECGDNIIIGSGSGSAMHNVKLRGAPLLARNLPPIKLTPD